VTDVRKSPCSCWDCLRSRGETPKLEHESRDEAGRVKRNIPLFLGAPDGRAGQVLTDADVLGHDRPPKRVPTREIVKRRKERRK
jgi:hypothetical protein